VDEWKNVSEGAKDLVTRLITKAEERLSAEDALKHPWLIEKCKIGVP